MEGRLLLTGVPVDAADLPTKSFLTQSTSPVAVSPGTASSPGPVVDGATPTFTWQAVAGAGGYQINVFDNTIKKLASYTVGATATSFTAPAGALASGDAFVWNVRTSSGGVTGPESNYLYFQTPAAVATPAPVAVSPGTASSPGPVVDGATPTFTWQAVAGAGGYQINVFDNTIKKLASYTVGATATSFTAPAGALASGDAFVWNVRTSSGGVTGPESNYLYFQTPAAVATPAPVAVSPGTASSPGPVVDGATPTFTWQAVAGAGGYQINVFDNTIKKLASYTVGATATSFTAPAGALASGDAFVWNVRTSSGGVTGPESNYLYFQTPAAVATPAPVAVSPGTASSPGPVVDGATPTFTWQAVAGAGGYQINVFDNTIKKLASYTVGATATSFTAPAGALASGDAFVWNVRTSSGGVTGPESNYLYFQTPAAVATPAPVAVSPGTASSPGPVVDGATPTFTWQAVAGAGGYQINVFDNTIKKLASYTVGATATSFTAPAGALASGDAFVWNVRTSSGGVTGPESNYLYFQTPAASTTAPTQLAAPLAMSLGSASSPGPALSNSTPSLTWQPVAGATDYQINVYDKKIKKLASFTVGATATSYTVPAGALKVGDSFAWNVRALNGTTSGPESSSLNFKLRASAHPSAKAFTSGGTKTKHKSGHGHK